MKVTQPDQDYRKLVSNASSSTASSGAMVPYYIAPTETFTVPLYKQALYAMDIDNEGTLDVQGFLIEVDGAEVLVPYYIAPSQTFTVPLYKQALYATAIDNEGTLDVLGLLIEVD